MVTAELIKSTYFGLNERGKKPLDSVEKGLGGKATIFIEL
jgi:hypothetical protein